ncbi:MAG: hypothetical protein JOZ69_22480 [Myxococcales bacterium]|nr:hypothetical protein [Myxococcales bacterium]
MVPKRVNDEVIGDALERIGAVVARGASRWELFLVYVATFLVVACEIVRYAARAVRGRTAR